MPKLIDYPRTTYAGAWELSEVVDDTGGKCAIDTAARKLNRKVSGSFKAIIGSAVKFGLLTSKRDLLSTTTLFKRIKHAYDKQEELLFHREAFLTPPLFTQLCRKFRSRELPVQMLDVMLIREFSVEEINAQNVAKAFVEGARMVGLLDEHNTIADIDQLAAQHPPRRELANPQPALNTFRNSNQPAAAAAAALTTAPAVAIPITQISPVTSQRPPATVPANTNAPNGTDAIATLFGLDATPKSNPSTAPAQSTETTKIPMPTTDPLEDTALPFQTTSPNSASPAPSPTNFKSGYQIQISGPGVDTTLSITDTDDLVIVQAMLEKIRKQLPR
jgi:hypothetical protein